MGKMKKLSKNVLSLVFLSLFACFLIIMNPKQIEAKSRIVQVSAGANFTAALNDDYENEISKAYNIGNQETITGRINYGGDVDVFEYTPTKDGIYSFEMISDFDSYGILYNSSGNQIMYNDDGNNAGESQNTYDFYFKYRLNKGKNYFIAVKNYNVGEKDTGNYTLIIRYNDDYENEISHAYNIGNKETIKGKINYGGDVDMFKFVPPETGTYTIESQTDIDMYGHLYNYSGNELTKNDDGNGVGISSNKRDFYIKYNLEAGKTYYIKVRTYSVTKTGDYILKVRRCFSSVVNNYYDQAFNVRYGSIGDCATKIQDTNKIISRVFKKTVNLDIANNTPTLITSLADNCKLKRGYTISQSTIDQKCPGGAGHEPNCTGWTNSFYNFYDNNKGNNTKTSVLWTGNAFFENTNKINRSFSSLNGVCIQEILNQDYYKTIRPVLAHELAHQYGAPDHYHEMLNNGTCRGGTMCKTCNPSSGRPQFCLMNDSWMNDISIRSPERIFCSGCLEDIKNHLKSHH